jgi:hypothetical protein
MMSHSPILRCSLIYLLLVHLPDASFCQALQLKVGLVSSTVAGSEDPRGALLTNIPSSVRREYPTFPFDSVNIDFFYTSYDTPCQRLASHAVATLSPIKYLECLQELRGSTPSGATAGSCQASSPPLRPLFVVKKRGQSDSFYSAYFITGRRSGIHSIASPAVRKIYLVNRNSASGYVAPLVQLFEAGIIDVPSEEALQRKGWDVVLAGEQREVLARLAEDEPAIAAVGQFPDEGDPGRSRFRLLLRYDRIPQDPLVISRDLCEYEHVIARWWVSVFTPDSGSGVSTVARALAAPPTEITGLDQFSLEHRNAFAELDRKRMLVRSAEDELRFPLQSIGAAAAIAVAMAGGWLFVKRRRAQGRRPGAVRTDLRPSRPKSTYDAFISYSTRDREAADRLCEGLEARGLHCWMAPRDIAPGAKFDIAVISAIRKSRALVLVLSSNSNASDDVATEVRNALDAGLPVIPLRIEDVAFSGALQYHLVASQWLDAVVPPLEAYLDRLASVVRDAAAGRDAPEQRENGSSR